MAKARPVICITLRTLGSKGEATKGVTRHLERGRETGSLLEKRAFTVTTPKMSTPQKARPSKSSLIDARFQMTGAETYTMRSRVVVVCRHGGLLCAMRSLGSLFNLSMLHSWQS